VISCTKILLNLAILELVHCDPIPGHPYTLTILCGKHGQTNDTNNYNVVAYIIALVIRCPTEKAEICIARARPPGSSFLIFASPSRGPTVYPLQGPRG
jgi:hypothetical protein